MPKAEEVRRRTTMVLMRHGPMAADFAEMVADELARSGDSEESETWSAVSREARTLLSGVVPQDWQSGGESALPSGRFRSDRASTRKG